MGSMTDAKRYQHPYRIVLMREPRADVEDVRWMRAGEFDRRQKQDGLELISRYVRAGKRHPAGEDVIYLMPWCRTCDAAYAEREWCSEPVWDPCPGWMVAAGDAREKLVCRAAPICYTRERAALDIAAAPA